MISTLKSLFSGNNTPANNADLAHNTELATAALLIEAATMDGDYDLEERIAIERILSDRFGLDKDAVSNILGEAEARQKGSNQILRFTRTIKDNCDEAERIAIIEMLWEVAYADGVLHHYEDNLLRRVGGLIYVSEHDRGLAKKRVMERLGISE